MADGNPMPSEAKEVKMRLPWFVTVSPEFYDDACDTGYGWEGWATDQDDAVAQALEECTSSTIAILKIARMTSIRSAPSFTSPKSTSAVSPARSCTGLGRREHARRHCGKPWKQRSRRRICRWFPAPFSEAMRIRMHNETIARPRSVRPAVAKAL